MSASHATSPDTVSRTVRSAPVRATTRSPLVPMVSYGIAHSSLPEESRTAISPVSESSVQEDASTRPSSRVATKLRSSSLHTSSPVSASSAASPGPSHSVAT